MTTDTFHADRRTGVGGSDSPALMGLSPWGGPMDVWLDKMGMREPSAPSLPMWLGTRLEPLVAELFTARTGIKVRRRHGLIRSKDHPVLIGHVDFTGLEVKTSRSANGWGPDGEVVDAPDGSAVPINYLVQVQHYLVVTGWPTMHVAVLIGHDDFRTYEVRPIPAMQRDIIATAEAFWQEYVLTATPPPLDGSEASRRYVALAHPRDDGTTVPATPEQDRLLRSLTEVRGDIMELERLRDELEVRIKDAIGDAKGIIGTAASASWSTVQRKPVLDVATLAKEYRSVIERLRVLDPATVNTVQSDGFGTTDLADIEALHTSTPDAYRRFAITPRKETTDA